MDASVIGSFRENVMSMPEVFFTPSEQVANEIKVFAKHAYDRTSKFQSKQSITDPLDELYVDEFDADQIWEQLRLLNDPLVTEMTQRIRTFYKNPDDILLFPSDKLEVKSGKVKEAKIDKFEKKISDVSDEGGEGDKNSDNDSVDVSDDGQEVETVKKKKRKKPRDVAEDGFFDWDEMDKAAEDDEDDGDMEADEVDTNDGSGEDEEDFKQADDSDAENTEAMKYEDFFDEESGKGEDSDEEEEELNDVDVHDGNGDDKENSAVKCAKLDGKDKVDDEELAERGIRSSHQRQRQRLEKEIKELEQEAVSEKPWLLKGEVRSTARPENSLLEAVLDYDRPVKAAPVITEEVSIALEEMIKKRILDDDYDDVIRKFASNEEERKNKLEDVSMKKSKEGLGEIYEKEYMKTAMGFEANDESKQDQEEIEVMFKSLCWKLDALSNYHFTPKPAVKELQVKPAVPAIALEEVVPMGVSDANLKAPEEVYEKKRKRGHAVLQSRDELTQMERKALRNAKKHARRKLKRQRVFDERLVAKLNPGLGNKYEKKKMLESIAGAKNITMGKEIDGSSKQFSNSKEFFTRLQDEVQQKIRNTRNIK